VCFTRIAPLPPQPAQLLRFLFLFRNLALLHLLFERVIRNRVQPEDRLVRVLDEHVLTVLHLETHVHNRADNTPPVVEVERHLRSKVTRLVGEHPQDDVVVVVLGVRA